MRILFDQGTPVPLRRYLPDHRIATAFELGWATLGNGDLLAKAETQGFDVLVTTDRNLKYQQDLSHRRIAILVLSTTSWPRIRNALPEISSAVDGIQTGGYRELEIP